MRMELQAPTSTATQDRRRGRGRPALINQAIKHQERHDQQARGQSRPDYRLGPRHRPRLALKLASEGARIVVNDLDAEPAARSGRDHPRQPAARPSACVGSVTATDFAERFIGDRGGTTSRASTSSSTTPATPGTT